MRPRMKSLGGLVVVLALALVLAISLMLGCTTSPKQYQLGFASTSPRLSRTGCLFEHDLFGGAHQRMEKEDWESD